MTEVISIVDSYAYPSWITATVIQRIVVPMTGGTPDEEVVAAAQETARTCAQQFEAALGDDPYLAGEEISLADLQVIPIYAYFSHTAEGQAALADTPKLRAWWERVAERASVVKTTPQLG
jgi:glutathione S-transferase